MICKKILIYLRRHKAKQTFANLPIFGCIYEGLFRLYTSWRTVYLKRERTPKHRRNMIDNIELKILDELLRTLLVSNSVKYDKIINETIDRCEFLKDVEKYIFESALLKLSKDSYVFETNKYINEPLKSDFNISFEGIVFIKNGGYRQEALVAQRKEDAYALLNVEQKLHASSLLRVNERLASLTWIIAIGTGIAAAYYLLEILVFFGFLQSQKT